MAGEYEIAQFPLRTHVERETFMLIQPGPRGTPMFRATPTALFGSLASGDIVAALGYTPISPNQTWASGGVESLGADLFISGTELKMSLTLTQNYVFSGIPKATALPIVETGLAAGTWWNNGGVMCIADGTA